MKYTSKNIIAVLLLTAGCQSIISSKSPVPRGQVNFYLSTTSGSSANIIFTLEKIEAENKNREWITVFEGKKEINSINLAGRQVFLSEIHLDTGKYERMKFKVTEASIVRVGKKLTLALPSKGEEAVLPLEFQIYRNKSSSLFLYWDPDKSIENKYLFMPLFSLKPQKMEIKSLILYVTNTGSNSVTVINRQNDHVVGTIAVGKAPMGIAGSPSGDTIYVANSGSNTISIIDTSHHLVTDTIPVNFGTSPRELAVSPDGTKLYVSNFHSNNVSLMDTASKSFLGQVQVGNNPLGIAANQSGNRVYVVNSASNNLSVIDPFLIEVIRTIRVGSNPTDLLVDRDKILVANAGSSNIYQISIHSLIVEKETNTGYGSHKLARDLLENIYTSNLNSNDVSVIPLSTNIIIQRITVEELPQKMTVDRDRRKLYVANGGSNSVSAIDLIRKKLIDSIPVGTRPYGLALVE